MHRTPEEPPNNIMLRKQTNRCHGIKGIVQMI